MAEARLIDGRAFAAGLVARVADGKLIEVWEHIYDLYDFDEFYGDS